MPKPPSPADTQDATPAVPPPPPVRRLRIVQILTVIAIAVALFAAVYFRDRLQELKQYGYAAVFLVGLVSNATLILPVPGLAVSSVMGGVLNPWVVGLVGGLGQALGVVTIFVLALIPNPVFDLGGMAAGTLRFPLWKFLASSIAGKVIKNIGFALAGYYGIEALFELLG